MERNLILPGNPRYQPKRLKDYFGYDNLYREFARVEIANLQVLGEIGVISANDIVQLTPEIIERIINIPTTEVDKVEREITKHDVRAWIRLSQLILPACLRRWMHVPFTSYDPLDTGRIMQFMLVHQKVLKPSIKEVILILARLVERFADTLQIGRTHGQHALPITVGFWLATILSRIVYNAEKMDSMADCLVGKISGAVGAHNAQVGLGLIERCGQKTFEERVLEKVGLKPAIISTQILPPEPLTYYLFSVTMLSAAFGQFGRDCRHLMRSEIAEIAEAYEEGQVGSSTMGQKRNPINFESLEGMWLRTKNEFGKVLDTLISDHQRDLVGSSVARDFPIIIVNLTKQLDTLLRKDKNGTPFLSRITVNEKNCRRNFDMSAHLILAEPLYIALQMAGYEGDAHELVNRRVVPESQRTSRLLIDVLEDMVQEDPDIKEALKNIPPEIIDLLRSPENYTGDASEKAMEIVKQARAIK